jgi:hypothetical protein
MFAAAGALLLIWVAQPQRAGLLGEPVTRMLGINALMTFLGQWAFPLVFACWIIESSDTTRDVLAALVILASVAYSRLALVLVGSRIPPFVGWFTPSAAATGVALALVLHALSTPPPNQAAATGGDRASSHLGSAPRTVELLIGVIVILLLSTRPLNAARNHLLSQDPSIGGVHAVVFARPG